MESMPGLSQAPDLWLRAAGQMASAAGMPGVGAPLSAVGGLTEMGKYPGREANYLQALAAKEMGGPLEPAPGSEAAIEAGVNIPMQRSGPTLEQQRTLLGGPPRSQGAVAQAMAGDVSGGLSAIRQATERRSSLPGLPELPPVPAPMRPAAAAAAPTGPRPIPFEEIAKLLVGRQLPSLPSGGSLMEQLQQMLAGSGDVRRGF